MGRRLTFDCLFPNRKTAQAQLKVALCRDAAKTCNNNKIETPIRKKNALKRTDSHIKNTTVFSDSRDTISNTLSFTS